MQEIEKKTEELTKTDEKLELMMQYKNTEIHLLFRSILEDTD